MKILLDESVPMFLLAALREILPDRHVVDHTDDITWKSKKDKQLLPDAAGRGYAMYITRDQRQLLDAGEVAAIFKSKMHWVGYVSKNDRIGLGLSAAAVLATVPSLVRDLEGSPQKLIRLKPVPGGRARFEEVRRDEVKYGPR